MDRCDTCEGKCLSCSRCNTKTKIWKQAQNEIKDVESMLLNKYGSNKPQLKDLIKLLFGKKEKICLLFEEDLG